MFYNLAKRFLEATELVSWLTGLWAKSQLTAAFEKQIFHSLGQKIPRLESLRWVTVCRRAGTGPYPELAGRFAQVTPYFCKLGVHVNIIFQVAITLHVYQQNLRISKCTDHLILLNLAVDNILWILKLNSCLLCSFPQSLIKFLRVQTTCSTVSSTIH
jgi:hypothetical protein